MSRKQSSAMTPVWIIASGTLLIALIAMSILAFRLEQRADQKAKEAQAAKQAVAELVGSILLTDTEGEQARMSLPKNTDGLEDVFQAVKKLPQERRENAEATVTVLARVARVAAEGAETRAEAIRKALGKVGQPMPDPPDSELASR